MILVTLQILKGMCTLTTAHGVTEHPTSEDTLLFSLIDAHQREIHDFRLKSGWKPLGLFATIGRVIRRIPIESPPDLPLELHPDRESYRSRGALEIELTIEGGICYMRRCSGPLMERRTTRHEVSIETKLSTLVRSNRRKVSKALDGRWAT